MKHLLFASLLLILSYGTGCATLMRGGEQKMNFHSEPQGATVTLNDGKNEKTLTTPGQARLKRKDKYQVAVSKEGFRPVQFELVAQWDGAAIGNAVLPGGSVGVATDRASGADLQFYKLETIKLPPAGTGAGPLTMIQHRGRLYTDEEYKKVLELEEKYRREMQGLN